MTLPPTGPVPPAAVDGDSLRRLLRHQASTVTVVTVPGTPPVGFTATSFTSVSLEPPLVSFCVGRLSSSWPTLADAEHVGVHLLARDQEDVARRFATGGVDRFAEPTRWEPGPAGVPILDGTLAWMVCRVVAQVPAGDHAIILAEPHALHRAEQGTPLLYQMGRYVGLDDNLPSVRD